MRPVKYKHDLDFSYTLGATLTYELLKEQPELAEEVYISSDANLSGGISEILSACKRLGVRSEINDKAFNILSPKGNCFLIGRFKKPERKLNAGSHIVLVNPSDSGNMGTIIRTSVGFGIRNLAVVRPAVDVYDPRTVRATMGALFHMNIEYFDSFDDYMRRFPENERYAFMLGACSALPDIERKEPYSLIFGNEATGLPKEFSDFCRPVVIRHSADIDSLNLPTAAGIAIYEFTRPKFE